MNNRNIPLKHNEHLVHPGEIGRGIETRSSSIIEVNGIARIILDE